MQTIISDNKVGFSPSKSPDIMKRIDETFEGTD